MLIIKDMTYVSKSTSGLLSGEDKALASDVVAVNPDASVSIESVLGRLLYLSISAHMRTCTRRRTRTHTHTRARIYTHTHTHLKIGKTW